jgi:hypothetical protein
MPATVLPVVVLGPTAVVLVALFLVLWRERTSTRDARIAIVSGGVLSLWAAIATVARLRRFLPAGMFEHGVRRSLSLDKTQ